MKIVGVAIAGGFLVIAGIGMASVLFPTILTGVGSVANTTNVSGNYWGIVEAAQFSPILLWLLIIGAPLALAWYVFHSGRRA